MLRKELSIHTFKDLLEHFPYRHVDRTQVNKIKDITTSTEYIQLAGKIVGIELLGHGRSKRMVAFLKDETGMIELTWFQGVSWVQKSMKEGEKYIVFGKVGFFMGNPQIVHPEIEVFSEERSEGKKFLEPVYPTQKN